MTDTLRSGQSLPVNGTLTSADGRFVLIMQGDGNLVLYRQGGAARWASATDGRPFGRLDMQTDGNFVLYDPAGAPLWSTGTHGHPGAFLILQDDGNLVIYAPNGAALWASGTNIVMRRVPGFLPSRNGFHFSNSFPNTPDFRINVLGQTIAIGNAANGLCGGMTYAARDIFQAAQMPPAGRTSPTGGPLFDFIARRLMDSFELPGGPLKYLGLMNPGLPDHETDASRLGIAPHGRSWIMIRDEWPRIRADLDAGRLVNMALVRIKSLNPGDLGHNHQVLAWGYDLDGNTLDIRLYDPNFPEADNVCLTLNLADPQHTTPVVHNRDAGDVFCFFRTGYTFASPPSFAPVVPPQGASVTVINNTRGDEVVRVFSATDSVMAVALTAGEFTIGAGGRDRWIFPAGVSRVKITANGRPMGFATPGQTITIAQDDRILVINRSARQVVARFYRFNDGVMVFTLPDGDRRVSPHSDLFFTVPAGMMRVKVVLDGNATIQNLGATMTVTT